MHDITGQVSEHALWVIWKNLRGKFVGERDLTYCSCCKIVTTCCVSCHHGALGFVSVNHICKSSIAVAMYAHTCSIKVYVCSRSESSRGHMLGIYFLNFFSFDFWVRASLFSPAWIHYIYYLWWSPCISLLRTGLISGPTTRRCFWSCLGQDKSKDAGLKVRATWHWWYSHSKTLRERVWYDCTGNIAQQSGCEVRGPEFNPHHLHRKKLGMVAHL